MLNGVPDPRAAELRAKAVGLHTLTRVAHECDVPPAHHTFAPTESAKRRNAIATENYADFVQWCETHRQGGSGVSGVDADRSGGAPLSMARGRAKLLDALEQNARKTTQRPVLAALAREVQRVRGENAASSSSSTTMSSPSYGSVGEDSVVATQNRYTKQIMRDVANAAGVSYEICRQFFDEKCSEGTEDVVGRRGRALRRPGLEIFRDLLVNADDVNAEVILPLVGGEDFDDLRMFAAIQASLQSQVCTSATEPGQGSQQSG